MAELAAKSPPARGDDRARALDRQNWFVLAGVIVANLFLLWAAAHAAHPLLVLAAAILFAFTNNTAFALLHEAVHGKFDSSPRRNAIAGQIAAAFFPTSFTLQTALHLTHHRNNRSDLERFDYIGPDEKVPLKTVQWFTILTGLYWVSIPLFWVFYAFVAELVPWHRLVPAGSRFARQTSAGAFLDAARKLPIGRIRLELGASLLFQFAAAWLLDLSFASWLACYLVFGLAWSSLQYADHAFSTLDRHEGAWNLRVSRFTRWLFLNYHDHLEHHRDVAIRWQDLPRKSGRASDEGRHFLSMLYLMWRGPRLLPGSGQTPARARQLEWTVLACHIAIFAAVFEIVYAIASSDFAGRLAYFDVAIPLDALAPFWPLWSLAYISIGPLLLAAALILRTPERTLPFLAVLVLQVLVAGLCFLAFPVAAVSPPDAAMSGVEAVLFAIADGINLTGNMMPSLHVALAISAAWAASARQGGWGRAVLWSWALAVCASTWLIRQHWLLDIVGGGLLAVVTMGAVYPWLIAHLARLEEAFSPESPRPG